MYSIGECMALWGTWWGLLIKAHLRVSCLKINGLGMFMAVIWKVVAMYLSWKYRSTGMVCQGFKGSVLMRDENFLENEIANQATVGH